MLELAALRFLILLNCTFLSCTSTSLDSDLPPEGVTPLAGDTESVDSSSDAIANGGAMRSAPQVGIVYARTWRGRVYGTGTLIGARHVLTAAHVVNAAYAGSVTVSLGGRSYRVVRATSEPSGADAAVLTLEASIASIAPMPLAVFGPSVCDYLGIIGYGESVEGARNGRLRGGFAAVTKLATYQRQFWVATTPLSSCTDYQPAPRAAMICSGDSGGPAIRYPSWRPSGEIVGVLSQSTAPCESSYAEGLIVDITQIYWWVQQTMLLDRY